MKHPWAKGVNNYCPISSLCYAWQDRCSVFFHLFPCHHHAPRQWDIQTWVEKNRGLVERPPTGIKNRERECCKQTRANSMPDRSVWYESWLLLTDWQTDHWTDESLHTEFHSICKSQDLVLLWKFNHLRLVLRYVNDLASLFSNYPTTSLLNEWRMIVPFSWSEGLEEVLVSVLLGKFVI